MNDWDACVSEGRAYVRLAEAAGVLLAQPGAAGGEVALLRAVRQLAGSRLRKLITELPPAVFAQVLAASDRLMEPVNDVSKN